MTHNSRSKRFLSRPRARHIVAVIAIGMLIFLAWLIPGGGNLRRGATVMQAQLRTPTTLALNISACNANPELAFLRETDVDVEVKVVADSHPFRGGEDCDDILEVQLQ